MARFVCPHCGYNRVPGSVAKTAGKGALVAAAALLNPVIGAIALTGLAIKAWTDSDNHDVECPGCGKTYDAED